MINTMAHLHSTLGVICVSKMTIKTSYITINNYHYSNCAFHSSKTTKPDQIYKAKKGNILQVIR